jgi:predicted secreted acid phosphatase
MSQRRTVTGRGVLLAALLASLTALASTPAQAEASGCPQTEPTAAFDTKWPINIGLLQQRLIVYRCNDYMKDFAAEVAKARAWVEQRVPQVDKPAVVFDIDETSLSNWEQLYHNEFAYVPSGPCDLKSGMACGQREWELSVRGVALKPTLELFRFLQTLKDKNGGAVALFFVTGRGEDPFERIATEWNLRREGYEGWQRLYMRPSDNPGANVAVYKTRARRDIEGMHYAIIANLGDQYSDLIGDDAGDHAERCYKLPNPFYFIAPGLPDAGLKCLNP